MLAVRLLAGSLVAAVVAGCHTAPHNPVLLRPAPSESSVAIIAPEPTPAPERDRRRDCDFASDLPWLVLLPERWLLDGAPVTPWELEKSLNAKRDLRAQIGGPPVRDMFIAVSEGVSPTELDHAVSIAASFRYDHISFKKTRRPARESKKTPTTADLRRRQDY